MELTNKQIEVLKNVSWINSEEDLASLAKEIREKFPIGRMYGDIYPWRQSVRELESALIRFFGEFGTDYTRDEIIKATNLYVSQYSPYNHNMRCSKYFIIKDLTRHGGDLISDLATYIDMIRDGDEGTNNTNNWLEEVCE